MCPSQIHVGIVYSIVLLLSYYNMQPEGFLPHDIAKKVDTSDVGLPEEEIMPDPDAEVADEMLGEKPDQPKVSE